MRELEFTGERLVPGRGDPELELEHVARYHFAASLAGDRKVLDIGSGSGYGAGILRQGGAAIVAGFDVDLGAVLYGTARFGKPGSHFAVADAGALALMDDSVDLIVSFEVIEHLQDPRRMLAEAARVLRAGGLFLVSTPNAETYRREKPDIEPNPFHVREYRRNEFEQLLREFFPQVHVYGQSTTEGVLLRSLSDPASEASVTLSTEREHQPAFESTSYFLAICAVDTLDVSSLRSHFHASELNAVRDRTLRILALQEELTERADWVRSVEDESARRADRVRQLQKELEERSDWLKSVQAEAAERAVRVGELQDELEDGSDRARTLSEQMKERGRRLLDLQKEVADRTRLAESLQSHLESNEIEQRKLQEEVAESTGIARRLQSEVDEKDRQMLARLRQIDALVSWSAESQANTDLTMYRLKELERGLERTAKRSGRHDRSLDEAQAVLTWQRDSLVEQAQRLQALTSSASESGSQLKELETSAYQHQIGLDHHSARLDLFSRRIDLLEGALRWHNDRALDVASDLVETRRQVERNWHSPGVRFVRSLARGKRRLQKRSSERARFLVERLRQAGVVFPRQRTSDFSVLLLADDRLELMAESLEQLARLETECRFDVMVVGLDPGDDFEWVARSVAGLSFRREVHEPLVALADAARRVRTDRVLVLDAGVWPAVGALESLQRSFEVLASAGVVSARLETEEGELVAWGARIEEEGRTSWLGCGADRDDPRFSTAASVDQPLGGCLMIRRELLLARLERQVGSWAVGGVREVSRRAASAGFEIYVQATAAAVCGQGFRYSVAVEGVVATTPRVVPEGDGDAESLSCRAVRGEARGPRILIIDHRLPTPDHDAGSLRMVHLIDLLRAEGVEITFLPENLLAPEPHASALRSRGVEVVARPSCTSIEDFLDLEANDFDALVLSRFHIAEGLIDGARRRFGTKPILFDTVDLQSLRAARLARLDPDPGAMRNAREIQDRELAVAQKADAVIVVSEFEQELLRQAAPGVKTCLLSIIKEVVGRGRGFVGRKDLFFVGGFEHPPNVDGVVWFVREIWPLVHERLPRIRLHLVGSSPPPEVQRLASDSVAVAGFVQDLTPYLEGCRLSVAPLRYGAGVKGKVSHSLAHGVPCVMTAVAAEGMHLEDGVSALICDDPREFANAVVRLYRSPVLWRRLSRNGLLTVREHFSVEAAALSVKALLRDLLPAAPEP